MATGGFIGFVGTITLLEVMAQYGCKNLVFSSSATMYDSPKEVAYTEESPISALNSYGRTQVKLMKMARLLWMRLQQDGRRFEKKREEKKRDSNRVLACDLHSGQSMGYFDILVDHVYCQPVILDYLASKSISSEDLVVVSPDVGGVARARAFFANKLSNAPLAIVDKRRHSHNVAELLLYALE